MPVLEHPATHSDDAAKAVKHLVRHIELQLKSSGYPELGNVEVVAGHGRIVLYGRVKTYYLKQMAQSLALSQPGVTAVENQVCVS